MKREPEQTVRRATTHSPATERLERQKRRHDLMCHRVKLLQRYDWRRDKPGRGEYLVAVYGWMVGKHVSSPCTCRHQLIDAAIWCKAFPVTKLPKSVVIVDSRSGKVKRSVRLYTER